MIMQTSLQHKKKRLVERLKGFDRLAIALSGGVDSSLLLAEAHAALGNRVIAVTARSPIHPDQEVVDAGRIAAGVGVPHLIIDSDELDRADFLANTPERCYICKKHVFGQLLDLIRKNGFHHLAHGANTDDLGDYRPGLRAAHELGVAAPLMDAGFNKNDIRLAARERGLFVWDKPPMACIATRFPYGDPISRSKVEQVRQAEAVMASAGIVGCRVRHHGDVARIECPVDDLPKVVAGPLRERIADQIRKIGFLHVSVDLEGYVSGSMNRSLNHRPHRGGADD